MSVKCAPRCHSSLLGVSCRLMHCFIQSNGILGIRRQHSIDLIRMTKNHPAQEFLDKAGNQKSI